MSLTISPAQIVEESGSPLLGAPDSWPRRPLGEVATILNGHAFKSKQFVAGGGKPLIRIRDIFGTETAVGYVGEYDDRYLVQPGELLVGMDGDFNSARWRGPEGLLNQRVCKIIPKAGELDLDFLTHVLPGYLQAIHDLTSSTTVTHLSSRDVAEIPIPLPPLAEQQRLAYLLGITVSKQQSSIAHLRVARRAIERFRQAVLAAACCGRLTADWRDRDGIDEGKTLKGVWVPATWDLLTLGDIAGSIRGGSTETPSNQPSEYPILRSSSVRAFKVDYEDVRFLEGGQSTRLDNYVREGDLLITRLSGSIEYVGSCALVSSLEGRRIQYPDRLFCCRLKDPTEAPWVELFFAGSLMRKQVEDASRSAAGHQRISIADLQSFMIARPPIAEQQEIVQRAAQLLTLADSLTARVDRASRTVERSSQAVLAKAFRGELLPIDPVATVHG